MPAIVGKNGVELQMPISLDGNEALALKASADMLKKIAKDAGVEKN
jgi:L-lactate dehydrogenase